MNNATNPARIPAGPVVVLALMTICAAGDTFQHPSIIGVVGTLVLAAITAIGIAGAR